MPSLQPRSVRYAGSVDSETIAALRLLDPGATSLADRLDGDGCDVAFLRYATEEELTDAVLKVRAGGWVCAEVKRTWGGPRRLCGVFGWQRAFRRVGLEEVEAYWLPPTLEWSTRMVCVQDVTAVRNTLSRHQEVRFGRLKELVGLAALRLRLFSLALPEGTVVGRRPPERKASA